MVGESQPPSQERARGAALGLPAEGPGSLATFGSRVGAFVLDSLASILVAGLFTAPRLPESWSLLAFAVVTVVTLVLFGQTPGMRLVGLRLAHPRGEETHPGDTPGPVLPLRNTRDTEGQPPARSVPFD